MINDCFSCFVISGLCFISREEYDCMWLVVVTFIGTRLHQIIIIWFSFVQTALSDALHDRWWRMISLQYLFFFTSVIIVDSSPVVESLLEWKVIDIPLLTHGPFRFTLPVIVNPDPAGRWSILIYKARSIYPPRISNMLYLLFKKFSKGETQSYLTRFEGAQLKS